ncbi:MAG TPA: hypothetical protein PK804_00210 [Candidatus Dojkabacteria bacterium]|jgi:hypothetical protein|nr:hypothetical protein [Candidatus Dojkabacteria bacterium]
MEKSREFKIVLSSLAVLFILSFASVYMLFNGKEDESVLGAKDNRMNVKDAEKLQYSKGIPYIFSQPPVSAFVGEKYEYIPRVVDLDSQDSDITLELIDGPNWMYILDGVVQGVPTDSGQESFVIEVSDGYNSLQEKSYIIVQEKNE